MSFSKGFALFLLYLICVCVAYWFWQVQLQLRVLSWLFLEIFFFFFLIFYRGINRTFTRGCRYTGLLSSINIYQCSAQSIWNKRNVTLLFSVFIFFSHSIIFITIQWLGSCVFFINVRIVCILITTIRVRNLTKIRYMAVLIERQSSGLDIITIWVGSSSRMHS